ncbi:MAG: hypothetical protein ACK5V3_05235 [Bdellovibrionales bacterium]
MKSLFTIVFLATSSLFAQDLNTATIKCVFTEPFLSVTYSVPQKNLSVSFMGQEQDQVRNFSVETLTVEFPGQYVAMDFHGNHLLKFTIDGKGSDGMSDEVYPISAILNLPSIDNTFGPPYDQLHGGCYFQ